MHTISENPDRSCGDSLFSLALYARCESALMWLLVTSGDVGTPAFDLHRGNAWAAAERAGYIYADEPQPALLQDNCEVHDAWHYGVCLREQERREEKLALERDRRVALTAAKDWAALGYPHPDAILADLRSGKSLRIAGHGFYPDGECVFIENEYGVPDAFGDLRTLTVADVEIFLADVANGEEWGLVPY
jgi:hypothetical protein